MSLQDILSVVPPGRPRRRWPGRSTSTGCRAHVAVIMDGNGRWAAQRHLPRVEGHRAGIESVRDVVEGSARLGHPGADALRVLGRELEAARHRSLDADGAAQAVPAPRAEHAAAQQHPVPRDRPGERARARHPRRARRWRRRRRPANTGMLFNIALNYGGRAEIVEAARRADRGRRRARGARRAALRGLSLHRRPARSRSADPHERRDARQQFPALADRLRRNLGHRNAVAGFPEARTCSRRSSPTRSATAATAASISRRSPGADAADSAERIASPA